MDMRVIKEIWDSHHGKLLGIFLGLVFGWFTIVYGVVKATFVSVCIGLGYYIGKKTDENMDWRALLNRLFNNR